MKWPPLWISIAICGEGREHDHHFHLWLPLFILGPIALIFLLALFLIALPFLIISLLFTIEPWRWTWFGIVAFFTMMHSLPGLRIDVESRRDLVHIAVY